VHGWVGQNIDIRRLHPEGTESTLWQGYIVDVSDDRSGTEVQAKGALYQVDEYVRAPLVPKDPIDVVDFIDAQLSQGTRPHLRLTKPGSATCDTDHAWVCVEGNPPSVTTQNTGSWNEALTSYVRDILFLLHETDGTRWILTVDPDRKPVLRAVKPVDSNNVDATVDVNWPGVDCGLTFDADETTNVVYGEGTDRAGQVWRNADYTKGIAEYEPLAHISDAHGDNIDESIIRRERHVQFPSGTSYDVGVTSAEQILSRNKDPQWVGNVTLTVDPTEKSRFELRAGENLQLNGHRGADRIVQIVDVQVNWRNLEVQLTVDEQARDVLTVAELLDRRRNKSTGVVANLKRGSSGSVVENVKIPWDDRAGSGYVPLESKDAADPSTDNPTSTPSAFVMLAANEWVVEEVYVAQKATIEQTNLQLYDDLGNEVAAPFYVAAFDGKVTPSDLDNPPLAVDHEWSSLPSGVSEIVGWGVEGQRAGYSPGLQSEGDSQTGLLTDDGTWQFELDSGQGSIWMAFWLDGDVTGVYLQGRMFQGVE
jgi:hypothetical protein